jgi:hypothetical protein
LWNDDLLRNNCNFESQPDPAFGPKHPEVGPCYFLYWATLKLCRPARGSVLYYYQTLYYVRWVIVLRREKCHNFRNDVNCRPTFLGNLTI